MRNGHRGAAANAQAGAVQDHGSPGALAVFRALPTRVTGWLVALVPMSRSTRRVSVPRAAHRWWCCLLLLWLHLGWAHAEVAFSNYAGTNFNTLAASGIRGELENTSPGYGYRSSAAQFTPAVDGLLQSITISVLAFPQSVAHPLAEPTVRVQLRGDVNNFPGPTLAFFDLTLQADNIIHQVTAVNEGDGPILTTSTKYWVAVEPLSAYSLANWYHGLVDGRRVDTYPPETGVLDFDDVSVGTMQVLVQSETSTSTTTTTTIATTTTTLASPCADAVGAAHASCVLREARTRPLCGDESVPAKVATRIGKQMTAVRTALDAAPGTSGRKLTRLLQRIDRGLSSLDRLVSRASTAKKPAQRISTECAATLMDLLALVRADLAS